MVPLTDLAPLRIVCDPLLIILKPFFELSTKDGVEIGEDDRIIENIRRKRKPARPVDNIQNSRIMVYD